MKAQLSIQTLNFWQISMTQKGLTIGSSHLLPFFLCHSLFELFLIETNRIDPDGYDDFVIFDAGDTDQILSEFLTIRWNEQSSLGWPPVSAVLGGSAPMPVQDSYGDMRPIECRIEELNY